MQLHIQNETEMKKILVLLVSAFVCLTASAKVSGIEDAKKGDFNLGLQMGVPPASGAGDKAYMPLISLDGAFVLTSGFINTKAFGQNGAVDLGFYGAFCGYEKDYFDDSEFIQIPMLLRSAFHFQFVPKLDTYAGAFAGVNIWKSTGDGWGRAGNPGEFSDTKACVGLYTGAKYYFSDVFGVKLEFGHDVCEDNYPFLAGGFSFRF